MHSQETFVTPAIVPNARRVVILIGADDDFDGASYMVKTLIPLWQNQGITVHVHRGLGAPPPADVAILHVDLTTIPEPYLALARTFPRALNVRVRDISKRLTSTGVIRRGDGYRGPVIIKTNRNSAGMIEAEAAIRAGGPARLIHRIRRVLPWHCRAYLRRYRIFDRVSDVPFTVWLNPDLVAERFQPERHDRYYCLRTWVFLGELESNSLSYSEEPVVKGRNVVRRESVPTVPDELRAIRRRLGFDYGKFDYAIVDGRVVLYDANRTPTLGGTGSEVSQNIAALADGIRAFF